MTDFSTSLSSYRENGRKISTPGSEDQAPLVDRFEALLATGPKAFQRDNWVGHFTGSALVANRSLDRVLLTLHAKLGLWLQLGGHADGDTDIARVAFREAQEESGILELEFFPAVDIFDLDIHEIPARPGEPRHLHYDVRYLILADTETPVTVSPESKQLRWVPLSDAYGLSNEWSMHRQFDKLAAIKNNQVQL